MHECTDTHFYHSLLKISAPLRAGLQPSGKELFSSKYVDRIHPQHPNHFQTNSSQRQEHHPQSRPGHHPGVQPGVDSEDAVHQLPGKESAAGDAQNGCQGKYPEVILIDQIGNIPGPGADNAPDGDLFEALQYVERYHGE